VAAGLKPVLRDSANAMRGADNAAPTASVHWMAKDGNCHTHSAKQMSGERRTDARQGEGHVHSELKAARRSTLTGQHGNGGL
jgi:hypothetical protein